MPEYIDRDKFLYFINHNVRKNILSLYEIGLIIKNQPGQDVEPVRHGRWVKNTRFKEKRLKCSECGFDSEFEFNFCPNCGARMDLED